MQCDSVRKSESIRTEFMDGKKSLSHLLRALVLGRRALLFQDGRVLRRGCSFSCVLQDTLWAGRSRARRRRVSSVGHGGGGAKVQSCRRVRNARMAGCLRGWLGGRVAPGRVTRPGLLFT